MSKHTPGPWYAKSGHSQTCSEDTTVAMIGLRPNQITYWWTFSEADEHGDAEADARLIAAAPELLDALRGVIAQMEGHDLNNGDVSAINSGYAAISKATGATP